MAEQPNDPNASQPPHDTPPPSPDAGPATPGDEPAPPTKDERTMAMVAHLLGIVLSVIGPLIIWVMKKDESKFIDDQGKEALNFQITILIAYVVCSILIPAFFLGCILWPLVWIVNLILCVMAGMKANEGVRYRYPFALRLIT